MDKYTALQVVATGAVWPRVRKHEAGLIGTKTCARCGAADEDLLHFYWTCPAIANIDDDDVRDTQHLIGVAKRDTAHQCLWLRGIPPKAKYPDLPEPVEEEDAYHTWNFEVFQASEKFYLDGSGGSRSSDKRLRRCGWAAIVFDSCI